MLDPFHRQLLALRVTGVLGRGLHHRPACLRVRWNGISLRLYPPVSTVGSYLGMNFHGFLWPLSISVSRRLVDWQRRWASTTWRHFRSGRWRVSEFVTPLLDGQTLLEDFGKMGHVRWCRNYKRMIKQYISLCAQMNGIYSKTRIVRSAYQVSGSPYNQVERHRTVFSKKFQSTLWKHLRKGRKHIKNEPKHIFISESINQQWLKSIRKNVQR